MTTHELAALLLAQPDVSVYVNSPSDDSAPIESVDFFEHDQESYVIIYTDDEGYEWAALNRANGLTRWRW